MSVHPVFVEIFERYADSPTGGAAFADDQVWKATQATGKLYVDDMLVKTEHVWRYSPYVLQGLSDLGLDEVEWFEEYAVALAAEISEPPWYHTALVAATIALALIGLVASAPAAEATSPAVAWALVALGVTDLVANAALGTMDFIRAREDEVAAVSSGFKDDQEKIGAETLFVRVLGAHDRRERVPDCDRGGVTGRQGVQAATGGQAPSAATPRGEVEVRSRGQDTGSGADATREVPRGQATQGRLTDSKYGPRGQQARVADRERQLAPLATPPASGPTTPKRSGAQRRARTVSPPTCRRPLPSTSPVRCRTHRRLLGVRPGRCTAAAARVGRR